MCGMYKKLNIKIFIKESHSPNFELIFWAKITLCDQFSTILTNTIRNIAIAVSAKQNTSKYTACYNC